MPVIAQIKVNVGILDHLSKNKIEINVMRGAYELSSEGKYIRSLGQDTTFQVRAYNHQILTEKKDQKFFTKSFFLRVNAKDSNSVFQIININGQPCDYKYKGDIMITAQKDEVKIINILGLDDYLVGVLRAEIGGLYDSEFLKSMAVISRTYTLRNLGKNIEKGYDLTDQVDCQVYMGMNFLEQRIVDAVKATTNEVIVDSSGRMIDAVFHSNSGGITSRASFAWSKDLEYLQETEDPYSICGKHFKWSYRIPKNLWHQFLLKEYDSIPEDPVMDPGISRRKYLYQGDTTVMMKDVRAYFKLKSALFTVNEVRDSIYFHGRGYGHGVGMSQEGAYEMSLLGKQYEDIILHYYHDVRVACFNELEAGKNKPLPLMNRMGVHNVLPQ